MCIRDRGTVIDYVGISNGDTSGLGTQVLDAPFRESLKGKDATSDEILNDTISGATLSSKPVLEGIKEAAQYQADKFK